MDKKEIQDKLFDEENNKEIIKNKIAIINSILLDLGESSSKYLEQELLQYRKDLRSVNARIRRLRKKLLKKYNGIFLSEPIFLY
ncbi:hypothetical protein GW950_01385 [Candidatus Wolfebacteria bacterium]|nr:hypothetical protein [Candidatus Wolfebacteria bacterium]